MGLATTRQIRLEQPGAKVTVLEKEQTTVGSFNCRYTPLPDGGTGS